MARVLYDSQGFEHTEADERGCIIDFSSPAIYVCEGPLDPWHNPKPGFGFCGCPDN